MFRVSKKKVSGERDQGTVLIFYIIFFRKTHLTSTGFPNTILRQRFFSSLYALKIFRTWHWFLCPAEGYLIELQGRGA